MAGSIDRTETLVKNMGDLVFSEMQKNVLRLAVGSTCVGKTRKQEGRETLLCKTNENILK